MSELTLTKEQVKRLQPVERHLCRAVRSGEIIGITATECRTILWPVYKEVYKGDPGNVYCNACIATVCRKLGTLYLKATEDKAEKGQKTPPATSEAPEAVNSTTPKEKTPQKAKNNSKKKTTKK